MIFAAAVLLSCLVRDSGPAIDAWLHRIGMTPAATAYSTRFERPAVLWRGGDRYAIVMPTAAAPASSTWDATGARPRRGERMLDPGTAQIALNAVSLLIACGAGVYAWASARRRATIEEIGALSGRVVALEIRVEGVASRDSLDKLSRVVGHIGGDVKAIVARMEGMGKGMDRIELVVNRQEQHLLDRK